MVAFTNCTLSLYNLNLLSHFLCLCKIYFECCTFLQDMSGLKRGRGRKNHSFRLRDDINSRGTSSTSQSLEEMPANSAPTQASSAGTFVLILYNTNNYFTSQWFRYK